LSLECVECARETKRLKCCEIAVLRVGPDPDWIDCENESFDLICCFDSLEHVTLPEAIVREWHRALHAKGQVWIWWLPWCHPYGIT